MKRGRRENRLTKLATAAINERRKSAPQAKRSRKASV